MYHMIINGALGVRKILILYCALPRPAFMRKQYIPSGPNAKTGYYDSVEYLSYPWYIRPSVKGHWGPKAWLTRLLGRKLPGDDGNKYSPKGWTFTELGPQSLRYTGIGQMNDARLIRQKRGGCPFAVT